MKTIGVDYFLKPFPISQIIINFNKYLWALKL